MYNNNIIITLIITIIMKFLEFEWRMNVYYLASFKPHVHIPRNYMTHTYRHHERIYTKPKFIGLYENTTSKF